MRCVSFPSRLGLSIALAVAFPFTPVLASEPCTPGNVTISCTVSGPDASGLYTFHFKVTNDNEADTVEAFEVNHGENQTGTSNASQPANWEHTFSYSPNDAASVIFISNNTPLGGGLR